MAQRSYYNGGFFIEDYPNYQRYTLTLVDPDDYTLQAYGNSIQLVQGNRIIARGNPDGNALLAKAYRQGDRIIIEVPREKIRPTIINIKST